MIEVHPVTPAIGAEISGIDFRSTVTTNEYEMVYQALLDHLVVFVRDVQLTPGDHLAFAKMFGQLDKPHPVYPHVEGFDRIVLLENDANRPPDTNSWHTDLTFKQEQPFASILVAREVPASGGDTLWSSNYAAYERLSDGMKRDLAKLDAVHDLGDFRNTVAMNKDGQNTSEQLKEGVNLFGCYIRPLIGTHPITGRQFLNFNEAFVSHIQGLTTNESNALKQYLSNHMNKPEDQVRWRWKKNDLAIWDNRVTMHYAVADYLPQFRQMNRITVVKDCREELA